MGFVVGVDDGLGNPPSGAGAVSVVLRPLADPLRFLTLGPAYGRSGGGGGLAALPAPAGGLAGFVRVLGKGGTESFRVLGGQVDLVLGAIEPETDRLLGHFTIEVIHQFHLYALCHSVSHS